MSARRRRRNFLLRGLLVKHTAKKSAREPRRERDEARVGRIVRFEMRSEHTCTRMPALGFVLPTLSAVGAICERAHR